MSRIKEINMILKRSKSNDSFFSDSSEDAIKKIKDMSKDKKSEDCHPSYMANIELEGIIEMAKQILDVIDENSTIDSWMESYISKSHQMISSVSMKIKSKK